MAMQGWRLLLLCREQLLGRALARRWEDTALPAAPGALSSTWSSLHKEGYMDGWANTNGSDSCRDLLLHEHSHRLDTQEMKSLDMGCLCVVPQCSWGHAKFLVRGQ